jgi:hypothetical protein
MNYSFSLPIGFISGLLLAAPIQALTVGEYFCQDVHRLSVEGYWTRSDGSFTIAISDTTSTSQTGRMGDGGMGTYRYESTSENFGNLTLNGGEATNTGFSWVYTFRANDNTLYDLEDLWDGGTYLKVYDPYGTNILDATCVSLDEAQ